jgi:hypothetical protein
MPLVTQVLLLLFFVGGITIAERHYCDSTRFHKLNKAK